LIVRRRIAVSIVLALGIALALSVRLGQPELHTDEITYMSSVLESMIQRSVFPVQGNGALFLNKPPLSLWLMRLSFEALGPSPFAARLPSVLAAAGTAVVLYGFGASVFGEAVGILAALIFAFTPGILMAHGIRSATPDSLEILLVTSAIVALEFWRRRRRSRALACLVACLAASAWVKSPFSLAVFGAYLLATELPARRAGRGTPRLGATIVLAAGAWTAAYLLWLGTLSAAMSADAVAKRLLLQQYVQRIEGKIGVHQGPEYYLVRMARDFGPLWLLPLGGLAAGWWASRQGRPPRDASYPDAACLAAWSLAAPVLATASASKLEWYAFLSYPGIALLLAWSAQRLARAVSGRRAVQAALLATSLLVLAWWLPVHLIWPAQAGYRGLPGRLWEIASHDPEIEVVAGPGFKFLRQNVDADRESRLFLRMLFWRGAVSPDPCRVTLVNRLPAGTEPEDALVLYRPARRGPGIWLVDGCNGWLVEQLGNPGQLGKLGQPTG
jgi:4-amino-4-deoxy-L-arabinose transferase-like glycosyltransferase